MIKQRRGIALQCIVNELGWFFGGLELRRYANPHTWPVVEIDFAELKMQLLAIVRCNKVRFDDEFFAVLPLASERRDDCARQGGLALRLKVIHDRRADQFVFILGREFGHPGIIDVRENSFLHQRD